SCDGDNAPNPSLSKVRRNAARSRWDRVRAGETQPHAGKQGNAAHQAVQRYILDNAGGETHRRIDLTNGRYREADVVDAQGRIHQVGDMGTRGGFGPDGLERAGIEDIRKAVGPDVTIIYHDKLGQGPSLVNPDLQSDWRPAKIRHRYDP